MKSQLLSPLHRATRQITLDIERGINEIGVNLKADEAHALSYVASYGPCPTGQVQRVLGLSRSTITSLVERLHKRGLIERTHSASDKRVILLETTEAGKAVAGQTDSYAIKLEKRILAELNANDRDAFQRIIEAIQTVTGVTVVDHRLHNKK